MRVVRSSHSKRAIVEVVNISDDGYVRSAVVRYSNIKGEHWTHIGVTRSVQRLVLIMPVEEQNQPLQVNDHDSCGSECRSVVKAGV